LRHTQRHTPLGADICYRYSDFVTSRFSLGRAGHPPLNMKSSRRWHTTLLEIASTISIIVSPVVPSPSWWLTYKNKLVFLSNSSKPKIFFLTNFWLVLK